MMSSGISEALCLSNAHLIIFVSLSAWYDVGQSRRVDGDDVLKQQVNASILSRESYVLESRMSSLLSVAPAAYEAIC